MPVPAAERRRWCRSVSPDWLVGDHAKPGPITAFNSKQGGTGGVSPDHGVGRLQLPRPLPILSPGGPAEENFASNVLGGRAGLLVNPWNFLKEEPKAGYKIPAAVFDEISSLRSKGK